MARRAFAVAGASGEMMVLDTEDLVGLGKKLKELSPALQRAFRTKLREAGQITALRAQTLIREMDVSGADEGIRTAIANDIKVHVLKSGIKITVGDSGIQGSALALSGLLELGAGGWKRGSFRHPLFGLNGSGQWYEQPTHPYLKPAIEETYPAFEAAVVEAVDEAKTELGLNGGE